MLDPAPIMVAELDPTNGARTLDNLLLEKNQSGFGRSADLKCSGEELLSVDAVLESKKALDKQA